MTKTYKIKNNSVAINSFVRRQTPDSPHSHFEGSEGELLSRIQAGMKKAKPGYREGVILVPIDPQGFYTSIKQLTHESKLIAEYKSRRKGEEPRKFIYSNGKKTPAQSVDIVLYHHDVLNEDGDAETNADWEVVSINANPGVEEVPIHPDTLIANHFHLDGGTVTNMNNDEFVKALRKSVVFWKDKANVI